MTITKDDLKRYQKRETLVRIAKAIDFFNTCYAAVPSYPENDEARENYLNALLREVEDMQKELTVG